MSQPPEERAYHHRAHLLNRKHHLEETILSKTVTLKYWVSIHPLTHEAMSQQDVEIRKARLKLRQAREALKMVKSELKALDSPRQKNIKPQTRWELVKPLLDKKGWTRNRWAVMAEVKPSTVQNYLNGKKTYPDTRAKLAKALEIEVDDLPN